VLWNRLASFLSLQSTSTVERLFILSYLIPLLFTLFFHFMIFLIPFFLLSIDVVSDSSSESMKISSIIGISMLLLLGLVVIINNV